MIYQLNISEIKNFNFLNYKLLSQVLPVNSIYLYLNICIHSHSNKKY